MNNANFMPWAAMPVQDFSYPRIDRSVIPGRVINNFNDMRPQDVPIDGSMAIFPQADMKRVYIKYWDKNCNLQTREYVESISVPVHEQDIVDVEPPVSADYASQLKQIEERLSALESKNKIVSLVKKEDEA